MSTRTVQALNDREESVTYLRQILVPGTIVHTITRHTSPSGVTQWLSVFIVKDGELFNITWHVGRALGWSVIDRDGRWTVKMRGAQLSLGAKLTDDLSRELFHGQPVLTYVEV